MRNVTFIIILISLATLSGCALSAMIKMAEEQELAVTPSPLEVHADTATFEISAKLPLKMLKPGKVYTVNTYYKYGEVEAPLKGIEFKADDFPNVNKEPVISQKFSFPYKEEMKRGVLEIKGVASDPKNGKFKETPMLEIAKGMITTSMLVNDANYVAFADHGYDNSEELIPTRVEFNFLQGSSALRSSEVRSEKGKEFEAFIAARNVTRTVTIIGTHSPEGSESINSSLAEDRAKAIEAWYRKRMKRYDYKGMADSIKFILKPVFQDWAEFKKVLASYEGVSSEDKTVIGNIIDGSGTFREKESRLKELASYKKIFKDVYPILRTAKTEVLTVKPKKTDAEISLLAQKIIKEEASMDTLSDEELSYAATLTPSLTEKEKIYKAATKKNDSWSSHNNLGAVYLSMAIKASGDDKYLDMAQTQFEIANKKKENAESYCNLANIYMVQGNSSKAYATLVKGLSLNPSSDLNKGINTVKGVLEIKTAKYDKAVASLSASEETGVNLFNKGLALILNKDYQNAATSLADAMEVDNKMAVIDYAAAIAAARTGNDSKLYESLKSAISKDPSYKAMAIVDLEFADYAAKDEFKDAIK